MLFFLLVVSLSLILSVLIYRVFTIADSKGISYKEAGDTVKNEVIGIIYDIKGKKD